MCSSVVGWTRFHVFTPFALRDKSKNLSHDEVNQTKKNIIKELQKEFNDELRK